MCRTLAPGSLRYPRGFWGERDLVKGWVGLKSAKTTNLRRSKRSQALGEQILRGVEERRTAFGEQVDRDAGTDVAIERGSHGLISPAMVESQLRVGPKKNAREHEETKGNEPSRGQRAIKCPGKIDAKKCGGGDRDVPALEAREGSFSGSSPAQAKCEARRRCQECQEGDNSESLARVTKPSHDQENDAGQEQQDGNEAGIRPKTFGYRPEAQAKELKAGPCNLTKAGPDVFGGSR